MEEFRSFSAKTVEEAISKAAEELGVKAEELEIEVVEKGSSGLLGFIGSKPAVIEARKKKTFLDEGEEFLHNVFVEMGMEVAIEMSFNEEENVVDINLSGEDMGVLIGKRGQTLDSLQHLVSLVINRYSDDYIRVKLDTENYRQRRKDTLEMLAKNIAFKVKRTRKPVALEPMTPYERRIIHSALQDDEYCYTKSEGEEPYRHVVVFLKKDVPEKKTYGSYGQRRGGYGSGRQGSYGRRSGYGKSYRDSSYDSYDSRRSESSSDQGEDTGDSNE